MVAWKGDTMWEKYRLFFEKLSLGSSSICFESINAFSLKLSTTKYLGVFWKDERQSTISIYGSLQTDYLMLLFPLPHGRDMASIPLV
jgi:hypothetical protein